MFCLNIFGNNLIKIAVIYCFIFVKHLVYRVIYLHNVSRYRVYAYFKMLFEPWGIDIFTSGKSYQDILIFKYWHVGDLWSWSCIWKCKLKNITFKNCWVLTRLLLQCPGSSHECSNLRKNRGEINNRNHSCFWLAVGTPCDHYVFILAS